ERLVGHRLHEAVAEEVERRALRADRLAVRHALLELDVRVLAAGADRAVVDERAAGDHGGAVRDGDARVLEAARGVAGPDPELRDLAEAARRGVLVALPAGLGVVDRTETLVQELDLVEGFPIGVVRGLVHEAVRSSVEPRGRLRLVVAVGAAEPESEEGE